MDFNYSLAGFFVGIIVGLTGVGGGSLMKPLLVLLFGISPDVDWTLLVSLLIGSLPGVVIGSLLTSRLPEKLIRNILVTLLVTVGGRLVLVK